MKTSLTQLLIHLDSSPRAAQRLEVARQLGKRHNAAIAALYAVTPSLMEMPFAPGIGPGVGANMRELDEEQRARARVVRSGAGLARSPHVMGRDPRRAVC